MNKKAKSKIFHYNFLKKNRKGADKILSMYWFVILIIVAGGITAMVFSFYNHPYDVREIEANILINKISDCLSQNGNLNSNLIDSEGNFSEDFKLNFLKNCDLNFKTEEIYKDKEQYFVEINFYKEDDLINSVFNISNGNKNFKADCDLLEEKKYKIFVECVKRDFYSLNGEEIYLVKILSIVRKTEKNVK